MLKILAGKEIKFVVFSALALPVFKYASITLHDVKKQYGVTLKV